MRPKVNFLEIWVTAFYRKNNGPVAKYGGGSMMVWDCFAASGPGRLKIIDGTMNSALYKRILNVTLAQ